LSEIQGPGGLRHMLAFGDGHKNSELIERHRGRVPIVATRGRLR
jgi:hypothetical protein